MFFVLLVYTALKHKIVYIAGAQDKMCSCAGRNSAALQVEGIQPITSPAPCSEGWTDSVISIIQIGVPQILVQNYKNEKGVWRYKDLLEEFSQNQYQVPTCSF